MTNTIAPHRLLVGISNPETMHRLVDLAIRLSLATGCEIVATHVVRVPGQIGLRSARTSPEVVAARQLLLDVLDRAQQAGVEAQAVVEVGREVHEGLIAAARSRDADLVLVGFSDAPGEADEASERRFDRVMHRVGRELDADLVIGKFRGEATDRILVPVEPASDFSLIALLVRALKRDQGEVVRFLRVSIGGDPSDEDESVRQRLAESGLAEVGRLETVESDDMANAVLAQAQDSDLILLETTSTPGPGDGLRGAVAERIAERAECSTLLLRACSHR